MKRIRIHHEGAVAGPFGELAGPRMAEWRRAELERDRMAGAGRTLPAVFFEGMAVLALVRTLDGRQN